MHLKRFAVPLLLALAAHATGQTTSPAWSQIRVPAPPAGAAADIVKKAGVSAGLAVFVGPSDAAVIDDLARTGGWLVHVLDTDAARVAAHRQRFNASGMAGLATAELRADLADLPFRDEMANVVIMALDTPGATPMSEALRILAPRGMLLAKEKGEWTSTTKPRPGNYGTWTHDYKDASGNAVADDKTATLPLGMQWLAGFRVRNHPAVTDETATIMQFTMPRRYILGGGWEASGTDRAEFMEVRDAFNGLPRVRLPYDASPAHLMINQGGRAFLYGGQGEPMLSLNNRTGADVVVYREGLIAHTPPRGVSFPFPWQIGNAMQITAVVNGNVLYQAGSTRPFQEADKTYGVRGGGAVVAVDVATGRKLWAYTSEERWCGPLVLANDGVLYTVEAQQPPQQIRFIGQRRGVNIIAIDAATGRRRWSTPVPESGQIGQLIALPGRLVVVASAHHTWNTDVGYVAVFDGANGKQVWQKGFYSGFYGNYNIGRVTAAARDVSTPAKDPSGANAIVFGNYILMHASYSMSRFDLATGDIMGFLAGGNQGCQRLYGQSDGTVMTFVSPNRITGLFEPKMDNIAYTQTGLNHPLCASGMEIANGKFYNPANGKCVCNFHLAIHQSYDTKPAAEPVPDAQRLAKPAALPQPEAALAAETPGFLHTEWTNGSYSPPGRVNRSGGTYVVVNDKGEAEAAESNGVTYVPITHRHQLEARRGAEVLWRFQANGRLLAAPLVEAGRVYVPGRDGYLYCLDAATGVLRWQFMAAAADRRLVNSGQVESVWPVFGVTKFRDLIWCGAGLQLDLDNGVFVWGLDPATGEIRKRVRLFNEPFTGKGVPGSRKELAAQINAPFSHVMGGGFAAHTLMVYKDQLVVGHRRALGSTGAGPKLEAPAGWVYGLINTDSPGPQRLDRTVMSELVRVYDNPAHEGKDFVWPKRAPAHPQPKAATQPVPR